MFDSSIVDVHRTPAKGRRYGVAITITYFLDKAFLQAFSSIPNLADSRDLRRYLRSRGVNEILWAKADGQGNFREVSLKLRPIKVKLNGSN